MSSPVGIGDVIALCKFVWLAYEKYKDAHDQFEEIATKARSTHVLLSRLKNEAKKGDSLVMRAGDEAWSQLQDMLASLHKDLEDLNDLVRKYISIRHGAIARRAWWAIRESDGLLDLRRRIGYHEQTLQLWLMALVTGSLGRIEKSTEKLLQLLYNLRQIPPSRKEKIVKDLRKRKTDTLKKELKAKGVPEEIIDDNVDENIDTVLDYVEGDSAQKQTIEYEVRMTSTGRLPHEGRPVGLPHDKIHFDECYPSDQTRPSKHHDSDLRRQKSDRKPHESKPEKRTESPDLHKPKYDKGKPRDSPKVVITTEDPKDHHLPKENKQERHSKKPVYHSDSEAYDKSAEYKVIRPRSPKEKPHVTRHTSYDARSSASSEGKASSSAKLVASYLIEAPKVDPDEAVFKTRTSTARTSGLSPEEVLFRPRRKSDVPGYKTQEPMLVFERRKSEAPLYYTDDEFRVRENLELSSSYRDGEVRRARPGAQTVYLNARDRDTLLVPETRPGSTYAPSYYRSRSSSDARVVPTCVSNIPEMGAGQAVSSREDPARYGSSAPRYEYHRRRSSPPPRLRTVVRPVSPPVSFDDGAFMEYHVRS